MKKNKKEIKEVEKEEIKIEHKFRNKLIRLFIFLVVIIILIVLYSKYLGTKGLEVKEYRIESNILSENFDGIKIVHFSDLFYNSTIKEEELKKVVKRINELKPEIIVFTGDLVKGKTISKKDEEILINNLSELDASIGKYAIYGENDFDLEDYEYIMNTSKFTILNNSYEEIFYKNDKSIYLVGIPSSIKEKTDLDKSFEFYNDENRKYIICLVHDGKTIKYIDESDYEVDLILGGHSLNGSIVLPMYGGIYLDDYSYKYYDEMYTKGITNIFISSGLGTNEINYRLNNHPSFNLYRLKAQS